MKREKEHMDEQLKQLEAYGIKDKTTIPEQEHSHIYWVLALEKFMGPFYLKSLKEFLLTVDNHDGEFFDQIFVCPYAKNPELKTNWHSLFDIEGLQRRKSSSPEDEENPFEDVVLEHKEFMIMSFGQAKGPYTLNQLRQMVQKKEVFPTDGVSIDGGEIWAKIYNIPEFDRRRDLKDKKELPIAPNVEILAGSRNIQINPDGHTDTHFLAALAYKLKHNKGEDGEAQSTHQSIPDLSKIPRNKLNLRYFYGVLAGLSLVSLLWMAIPNRIQNPAITSLEAPANSQTKDQQVNAKEGPTSSARAPSKQSTTSSRSPAINTSVDQSSTSARTNTRPNAQQRPAVNQADVAAQRQQRIQQNLERNRARAEAAQRQREQHQMRRPARIERVDDDDYHRDEYDDYEYDFDDYDASHQSGVSTSRQGRNARQARALDRDEDYYDDYEYKDDDYRDPYGDDF